MVGPVVDNLSRLRVVGWAGEHGFWVDPAAMSSDSCPVCDALGEDE